MSATDNKTKNENERNDTVNLKEVTGNLPSCYVKEELFIPRKLLSDNILKKHFFLFLISLHDHYSLLLIIHVDHLKDMLTHQ